MVNSISSIDDENLKKLYLLYTYSNDCYLDENDCYIDENDLTSFRFFINSLSGIPSLEILDKYILIERYFKMNHNVVVKLNNRYPLLLKDQKEHFRYLCFRNIYHLNDIKININKFEQPYTKHNETVFIEFRNFHHIEFNLRNICLKLPTWKHTVICGPDNYSLVKSICNNISNNINIIKMDVNISSIDDYSLLLGSSQFWNLFTGDHILIHQDDSLILDATNIEEFLAYDYVGAVWRFYPKQYSVGNGGFSLRNRQIMITICDTYDIQTYEGFQHTKHFMKSQNLQILPEDCFFSKCMVDNNIGNISPYDIAIRFSYEWIYHPNTIGCHNPFLCNENWVNHFTEIINSYH